MCCKSIFDISTRNKDSTWSDSAQTGSKTAARRFDCFTRPWCNGAGIPQCFAFHAFRTHPANSAAGLCYPSSRLQMIGRRTARLTPAAPPSATHPRRSRGPPAGGSGANPRVWRRGVWGRARADASSRGAPRPAGPRAHGSAMILTTIRKLGNSRKALRALDLGPLELRRDRADDGLGDLILANIPLKEQSERRA